MDETRNTEHRPMHQARVHRDLLEAVELAKAAYEKAKSDAKALRDIRECLGPGRSDGTVAALQALRIERAASRKYVDAVKALSNFILDQ